MTKEWEIEPLSPNLSYLQCGRECHYCGEAWRLLTIQQHEKNQQSDSIKEKENKLTVQQNRERSHEKIHHEERRWSDPLDIVILFKGVIDK